MEHIRRLRQTGRILGLAMRHDAGFGTRVATASMVLGALGAIGAFVSFVVPDSDASAAAVIAIALFHLVSGWRTMGHPGSTAIDLGSVEAGELAAAER